MVTPSGPSNNKTYTYVTPTPTLTLLNPSSGSTVGGINVTLTGTNFTGATAVNWGGSVIPLCGTGTYYTVDSDTQITVDNIPSGAAGGVTVNVVTPSGPSNNKTYTSVTRRRRSPPQPDVRFDSGWQRRDPDRNQLHGRDPRACRFIRFDAVPVSSLLLR